MKTEKIEAFKLTSEKDANGKPIKVKCGETEWERPETIAELTESFDDEEIISCFVYGFVVKEQARIRNGESTKAKNNPLVKKFAALTPEEQRKILEQLGH